MGQTDIGCAMASGTSWFKVPQAIKVNLTGKLPKYVKGKDIILTIIGMIGVDGARYQSLEFTGEGVSELSMSDRLTICNMAIEAGGKNGIFPVDEKTIEFLKERGVTREWEAVTADEDAEYARVLDIKLDELVPVVAYPHLPENTHPAKEDAMQSKSTRLSSAPAPTAVWRIWSRLPKSSKVTRFATMYV